MVIWPPFFFSIGSPVHFGLADVGLLSSCMGQAGANTAPRPRLDMDHAGQCLGTGWERSEEANRPHSSSPASEEPEPGECFCRGVHQPPQLARELTLSGRRKGMTKRACLPSRGVVYSSETAWGAAKAYLPPVCRVFS